MNISPKIYNILSIIFFLAVAVAAVILMSGCARAGTCPPHTNACIEGYTLDQWADAIYRAENSHKHPYGIMVKYAHTSPRNACINTILHKYRDWAKLTQQHGLKQGFLWYLGNHYSPVGALNDPTGLNIHWQVNVLYWLQRV